MPSIEIGQVHGKLRVIARHFDGRWRCACLQCRANNVLVSERVLLKRRACFDCMAGMQRQRERNKLAVMPSAPRVRVAKDEHGWAEHREAA